MKERWKEGRTEGRKQRRKEVRKGGRKEGQMTGGKEGKEDRKESGPGLDALAGRFWPTGHMFDTTEQTIKHIMNDDAVEVTYPFGVSEGIWDLGEGEFASGVNLQEETNKQTNNQHDCLK